MKRALPVQLQMTLFGLNLISKLSYTIIKEYSLKCLDICDLFDMHRHRIIKTTLIKKKMALPGQL
jgi:hypothetical protein